MSKRPSFQFYPSDWRTDAGLRLCSLGARGLWIEMLTIMHDGVPYGHLTADGRPLSAEMLARLVGESRTILKKFLQELEKNHVYSTTDGGVIFCRRMVRDETLREKRANGGNAGASHGFKGAEHGHKGGRPSSRKRPEDDAGRGVKNPPLNPPPSSSSSSSSPFTPPSSPSPNGRGPIDDDPDGQLGGTGKAYAFQGRTIRLNRRDFDQWAASYDAIPDLRAELQGIDDWLQGENVADSMRRNWFNAVSRLLGRKHEELLAARRAAEAEDAAFFARHPAVERTEDELRALLGDEEFDRRQPTKGRRPTGVGDVPATSATGVQTVPPAATGKHIPAASPAQQRYVRDGSGTSADYARITP